MQTLDTIVLATYIIIVLAVGFWFARRSGTRPDS